MKKIFGFSLYFLALIPLGIYIYISNSPNYNFSEMARLSIIGISSILMYFGGLLLSLSYNSNKPMKINLLIVL